MVIFKFTRVYSNCGEKWEFMGVSWGFKGEFTPILGNLEQF
jgi:hypothetical protein